MLFICFLVSCFFLTHIVFLFHACQKSGSKKHLEKKTPKPLSQGPPETNDRGDRRSLYFSVCGSSGGRLDSPPRSGCRPLEDMRMCLLYLCNVPCAKLICVVACSFRPVELPPAPPRCATYEMGAHRDLKKRRLRGVRADAAAGLFGETSRTLPGLQTPTAAVPRCCRDLRPLLKHPLLLRV